MKHKIPYETFVIGEALIATDIVGRMYASADVLSIAIYNKKEEKIYYKTFNDETNFKRVLNELKGVMGIGIMNSIKV